MSMFHSIQVCGYTMQQMRKGLVLGSNVPPQHAPNLLFPIFRTQRLSSQSIDYVKRLLALNTERLGHQKFTCIWLRNAIPEGIHIKR